MTYTMPLTSTPPRLGEAIYEWTPKGRIVVGHVSRVTKMENGILVEVA